MAYVRLDDRQTKLAEAWGKAVKETGANVFDVVRVCTSILGVSIIKTAYDRDDAMRGVRALTNDLIKQLDKKWGPI